MTVPNQTRDFINQEFSPEVDKKNEYSSLRLQSDEKTTLHDSLVNLIIWLLVIPFISLILILIFK